MCFATSKLDSPANKFSALSEKNQTAITSKWHNLVDRMMIEIRTEENFQFSKLWLNYSALIFHLFHFKMCGIKISANLKNQHMLHAAAVEVEL